MRELNAMSDQRWVDAADAIRELSPSSVIGPAGLALYLGGIKITEYTDPCPQLNKSTWVLHRGMADQWPPEIIRRLKRGRFKIFWSNEVFTILKPTILPRLGTNKARGNDEISFLNTIKSIDSIVNTKSKPEELNKYEVDRIVHTLADVRGWEDEKTPNTSSSGEILREMRLIKSNIKTLAWKLEQLDSPAPLYCSNLTEAFSCQSDAFRLESRLCTSSDIYSDWHRRLSSVLKAENFKLRKIWEWTYTLKVLHACGMYNNSARGIGFGCGTEPLASCFANFAEYVLITDAPISVIDGKGWADTNQHTTSLESAKYDWLAPRELLDKVLDFDYADMNNIPTSFFDKFNFVWSSCALEHLGSKLLGLRFIVESAKCLKVGGIAIHTTEFDLSGKCHIDNWQTVLFNESDLKNSLTKMIAEASSIDQGPQYELVELNLSRGKEFIDGYVDIPPYSYHWDINDSFKSSPYPPSSSVANQDAPNYQYPQVNLSVDGYPSTSVALVIRRIK
jgi:hypothetical protein